MRTSEARALRLVEARLGRPPQDMLEAAVALEAWAGVPAQQALDTARRMMPRSPLPAQATTTVPPAVKRPPGLLIEGAAFLLTVPAIAFWAAPLADSLGDGTVESALRVALPLTLALQWMLRSRWLGRTDGLAELARRRRELLVAAVVLGTLPASIFGAAGAVSGLLALTWTAGSVLVRRGWAPAYAAIVLGCTAALLVAPAPLAALAAGAAVASLAAAAALRPPDTPGRSVPGRWSRTAIAGALGAGLGLLLVGDPSVTWTAGAIPALALLPSAVAGFVGGSRLWKLQEAVPRALTGIPVSGGRRPSRAPLRSLAGAVVALVAITAAGSALLLATPWLGSAPERAGVLAGFGLLALATLLLSLLDSLGRAPWALAGVAVAVIAELALRNDPPFAGAALVAGGAVAVAVLAPAVVGMLAGPARTLATSLWIQ